MVGGNCPLVRVFFGIPAEWKNPQGRTHFWKWFACRKNRVHPISVARHTTGYRTVAPRSFALEKIIEVTMEPRAPGVSSTLAFVEQAVHGHLKMDD